MCLSYEIDHILSSALSPPPSFSSPFLLLYHLPPYSSTSLLRKQDFHELKRLQREEMKEATEFFNKIKLSKETQERKFETELSELERRYEAESEAMGKRQKREIEKLETYHISQYKSRSKQLKSEQVGGRRM